MVISEKKSKSLVLVNFELTRLEQDSLKLFQFNDYIFPNDFRRFLSKLCFFLFNSEISCERIYLFHETSPLVLFHYFKREVILLEHGISNYIDMAKDVYETKKYHLFKRYILRNNWIGESSFIDKIYLRRIDKCPEVLLKKTLHLDLSYYFEHLENQYLSAFNTVFGSVNFEDDKIGDTHFVVLTQPFSEEGIMTEARKIEMYRFILSQFDTKVLIKPHPKETTNYKIHFRGIRILDSKTPFELYALNSINFNQYITVTSSSITGIDEDKVMIYGEDFLSEWK